MWFLDAPPARLAGPILATGAAAVTARRPHRATLPRGSLRAAVESG